MKTAGLRITTLIKNKCAAIKLGAFTCDKKSEPTSLLFLFQREERLENFLSVFRRDSSSVVFIDERRRAIMDGDRNSRSQIGFPFASHLHPVFGIGNQVLDDLNEHPLNG